MSRLLVAITVQMLLLGLMSAGCDPVRTTSQNVRLHVSDHNTERPVVGAMLIMKRPYGGVTPSLKRLSDQEWLRQLPHHCAATNSNGVAVVDVKITAIDHTSWVAGPHDWVSEMEYLFGISYEGLQDVGRAKVKEGGILQTERFQIEISKIGVPRYIQVPQ